MCIRPSTVSDLMNILLLKWMKHEWKPIDLGAEIHALDLQEEDLKKCSHFLAKVPGFYFFGFIALHMGTTFYDPNGHHHKHYGYFFSFLDLVKSNSLCIIR